MARDEAPDDCMRCGACCFSESPEHARVTGDDHARLGDRAEELVEWIGNEAFMRIDAVRGTAAPGPLHTCVALTADPATGTFACSIYDARPQVCRDLERGSGACLGELTHKGDRPARALVVLGAARRAARG